MQEKKVLNSGLTIVCEEIPYVQSVSLGILFKVGSRYESQKEKGLSHFIEHMLFKGTKTRSAFQIAESFDMLGTHVDAFTGREYTCLYVKMIDSYLPKVLELIADMLVNSRFDKKDIEKEQQVILEEIKMYLDSPDEALFDIFMSGLFKNHPLGRPILGENDTVKSFTKKDISDYFAERYTPGNAIISLAGNLKCNKVFKLVEEKLSRWQGKKRNFVLTAPGYDYSDINRKKKLEQMHICIGTKGLPFLDDRIYTLSLLNDIFGGSMSSHLFQEVREKRGLAYAISSFHDSYKDAGVFAIYAGTDTKKKDELITVIHHEIKKLRDGNVSEKEIKKAKEQSKNSLILSMESTSTRMVKLLRQEYYYNRPVELAEIVRKIDAVTKDGIVKLANELLAGKNIKTVAYGPF